MDYRYLNPVPPDDGELTDRLFVNREPLLLRSIAQLSSILEQGTESIVCAHGPARVGKSHFMRRVLTTIVVGQPDGDVILIRNRPVSAIETLRDMVKQADEVLHNRSQIHGHLLDEPIYTHGLRFLADVTPLIEGAQEVTFEQTRRVAQEFVAEFLAKIPVPTAIDTTLKNTLTEESEEKLSVKLGLLDTQSLADILRTIAETARLSGAFRKLVLFFDDFDLLADSDERKALHRTLVSLARCPSILVVATVRQDYYSNHFHDCFELAAVDAMTDRELADIYARHRALLGTGYPSFSDPAIARITSMSDGRPGYFLAFLRDLDRFHEALGANGQIDAIGIDQYLSKEAERFRREHPEAMTKLQSYITQGRDHLNPQDSTYFQNTSLVGKLLNISYSDSRAFEVDPIRFAFLRQAMHGAPDERA